MLEERHLESLRRFESGKNKLQVPKPYFTRGGVLHRDDGTSPEAETKNSHNEAAKLLWEIRRDEEIRSD